MPNRLAELAKYLRDCVRADIANHYTVTTPKQTEDLATFIIKDGRERTSFTITVRKTDG